MHREKRSKLAHNKSTNAPRTPSKPTIFLGLRSRNHTCFHLGASTEIRLSRPPSRCPILALLLHDFVTTAQWTSNAQISIYSADIASTPLHKFQNWRSSSHFQGNPHTFKLDQHQHLLPDWLHLPCWTPRQERHIGYSACQLGTN
jgi:hypothetical protein